MVLGREDRPHEQAQPPHRWVVHHHALLVLAADAAARAEALAGVLHALSLAGPLHVHAVRGTGRPGVAAAVAAAAAEVDAAGSGPGAAGTVVDAADTEAVGRVLRRAREEAGGPCAVRQVVVVEHLPAVVEAAVEAGDTALLGLLAATARDGAALGVTLLAAAPDERSVPVRVRTTFGHQVVLGAVDPAALAALDVPAERRSDAVGDGPLHGRSIPDGTPLVLRPGPGVTRTLALASPGPTPAFRLPAPDAPVAASSLPPAVRHEGGVALPVGADDEGRPLVVRLAPGGGALVVGPPASGRTTTLAAVARAATPLLPVIEVRSAADVPADGGPALVLVDDADDLDAATAGALEALLAARHRQVHVVVAGSPERLRSFGHWSAPLRAARSGVLLAPAPSDGDLLGVAPGAFRARRGGWPAGGAVVVTPGHGVAVGRIACETCRP